MYNNKLHLTWEIVYLSEFETTISILYYLNIITKIELFYPNIVQASQVYIYLNKLMIRLKTIIK